MEVLGSVGKSVPMPPFLGILLIESIQLSLVFGASLSLTQTEHLSLSRGGEVSGPAGAARRTLAGS